MIGYFIGNLDIFPWISPSDIVSRGGFCHTVIWTLPDGPLRQVLRFSINKLTLGSMTSNTWYEFAGKNIDVSFEGLHIYYFLHRSSYRTSCDTRDIVFSHCQNCRYSITCIMKVVNFMSKLFNISAEGANVICV